MKISQMKKAEIMEYLKRLGDKYKYVLAVCIVGLALVSFPTEQKEERVQASTKEDMFFSKDETAGDMEKRLEEVLSQISGVGRVEVMLTLKSGSRWVYAYNENKNMSQNQETQNADTSRDMVLTGSSGSQQPVVVQVDKPCYMGALIVCDGAADSSVRLDMTNAVSSLTGISSDKIVISKMK